MWSEEADNLPAMIGSIVLSTTLDCGNEQVDFKELIVTASEGAYGSGMEAIVL